MVWLVRGHLTVVPVLALAALQAQATLFRECMRASVYNFVILSFHLYLLLLPQYPTPLVSIPPNPGISRIAASRYKVDCQLNVTCLSDFQLSRGV